MPERHPATLSLLRYFEFEHLKTPLRQVSAQCHDLAHQMVADLPAITIEVPEATI